MLYNNYMILEVNAVDFCGADRAVVSLNIIFWTLKAAVFRVFFKVS